MMKEQSPEVLKSW
jgi:hypothetical protein